MTFTWPNVPPGTADNYKSLGQTVPVTPVSSATTLAFLGSALSASASGTGTITYSDGSTQSFTLGFTHWTTKTPAYGNTLVATMAYYNTWTGKVSKPVYLFYAGVTLQAGKTVSSVTLPANIVHAQLHIFAIATK